MRRRQPRFCKNAAQKCMMAVMFDWNDLRHLIAVSRHGSTLAAAKALGVNRSTVYRRLSACRIAVPARVDLKFHGRPRYQTTVGASALGSLLPRFQLGSSIAASGRDSTITLQLPFPDIQIRMLRFSSSA
jgi:hypothetical protein